MPSRQMAFQLTQFQYQEALSHLVAWFGHGIKADGGRVKIGEMIDSMVADERKRDRYKAVLLISLQCHEKGVDPMEVRKLVCWRNPEGKPSEIEAEVHGRRLRGAPT